MGFLDKIKDFDTMPLSQISFNMVKWFGFNSVDITVIERHNVESGVWISIKICQNEKTWYVDGQRIDVVKHRLIKLLKNEFTL